MYYIIGHEIDDSGAGVARKVKEQIQAFNNNGLKCSLYVLPYYDMKCSKVHKILRRLPFTHLHKHWNISDLKDDNQLYIRYMGPWDGSAIKFFEQLKSRNKNIRIVCEIPTYPYDSEFKKNWKLYPLYLKDKYNRRYLYKFIDRIATLTDDKEIFGIPTLKIGNGIDVKKIRPRRVSKMDEIHAIAVANFAWWHGYDRFIEGMKIYYANNQSRKVVLHLVGHGSEFGRYKKMVADYNLEEYVILHDQQTGANLDAIYDQCNLAVASLGCYRKAMHETAELKTREYLAKGLPFITSVKIIDIDESEKNSIYMKVVNDDSSIDIATVIKFYDQIYSKGAKRVNDQLRQYAQDHLSMELAMKNVIDYFKA